MTHIFRKGFNIHSLQLGAATTSHPRKERRSMIMKSFGVEKMTHPIRLAKALCATALFLLAIGCSGNDSNPMSTFPDSSVASAATQEGDTFSVNSQSGKLASPNAQIDRNIDHDLEDRLLDAISAIKGERVNMEDVVQIEAVLREADQDSSETEQKFELRLMDAVSDIIGRGVNMDEALQIEAAIEGTLIGHSASIEETGGIPFDRIVDRDIDHDLEDRLLDAISAIKGERVNMEDVVQIEAVIREADQDSSETEKKFELRLMDAVSDVIGRGVNMEETLQIEAAIKDSVSKEEE